MQYFGITGIETVDRERHLGAHVHLDRRACVSGIWRTHGQIIEISLTAVAMK